MEEEYFQELRLPEKVNVEIPVPCLVAETKRYYGKLIFICRDHKGKNAPTGISGFEERELCCATCFKEGKFIQQVYIDTSQMKDCKYLI
jgi:hypothetical protein